MLCMPAGWFLLHSSWNRLGKASQKQLKLLAPDTLCRACQSAVQQDETVNAVCQKQMYAHCCRVLSSQAC